MPGRQPPAPPPCPHRTVLSALGIKACVDCGAPLNRRAREIAAHYRRNH